MKKEKSFRHFYRNPPGTKNFVINGIGVREPMSQKIINRPNGTGDSLLMFFYNKVIVNIRNKLTELKPGSLIYWEKCGHYYGNTQIDWLHSWIHFDGGDACSILRNAGIQPYQVITPPEKLLEKLLTEIDREINRPLSDILIIRDRFEIFIRETARAGIVNKDAVIIPRRMLEIRQYIEENFNHDLSLAQIARKFSISSPHLSGEFKRWFGIAPMKYLIDCRLHEAEILLKDNNLHIAEIAEKVGWNDVYHFSKIFKKHQGMPPSNLRNKTKNHYK